MVTFLQVYEDANCEPADSDEGIVIEEIDPEMSVAVSFFVTNVLKGVLWVTGHFIL